MLFGLCNAGSVNLQMLDLAMAHLPAKTDLDDILVYSTDLWGHLEHLRKVVQANSKAGSKIQSRKPRFFSQKYSISA